MLSERELLNGINEVLGRADSANDCWTLAAFYTIYDHLYAALPEQQHSRTVEPQPETVIHTDCSDEFLKLIEGKPAADMWDLMSELMFAVEQLQPNLYRFTLKKIKGE